MQRRGLPILLSIASIVSIALTACSLAPEYSRPTVDGLAGYKEEGPWRLAAGELREPEKWWRVFADPALDALVEQLIVDNQNIKLAEAQYKAAHAALNSARAGLFPTLGASAAASRSGSGTAASGSAASTSTVSTAYTLSAQAAWEIDLWGRVRGGVDAAGAKLQASEGVVGAVRLSAVALLVQSYFQLRAADAQQRLLTRTLAAYQRFLELTRNRRDAGVASSLDVAQAETQLNATRGQLADVQLLRAQTEHAIATLIGQPPSALSISEARDAAALPPVPPAPTLVPAVALESRYDIYSAERQMAAANAQIGVARAAYFPALDLSADGGYRRSQLANLLSAPARFWSLGPTLALTLFDGGARTAAVSQAEAVYEQAVASYRQTVLTAFQEVEDNLVAMRRLAEESASQQAALVAAGKARAIAENQYRAGTANALNVIAAQASELNAESAVIAIWSKNMVAAVQLYKNLGGRRINASPGNSK